MELVWLLALVVIYFLPLFIAVFRSKHNAVAISILNLVAGWTFIGWVVALVWACVNDKPPSS